MKAESTPIESTEPTERAETDAIGSPPASTMSTLNAGTSRLRSRIDPCPLHIAGPSAPASHALYRAISRLTIWDSKSPAEGVGAMFPRHPDAPSVASKHPNTTSVASNHPAFDR